MKDTEKYLIKILISKFLDDGQHEEFVELENFTLGLERKNQIYWPNKIKVLGSGIAYQIENFIIKKLKNKQEQTEITPVNDDIYLKIISDEENNFKARNIQNKEFSQHMIYIRRQAFDKAKLHSRSDKKNEVGGILLGKYFSDDDGTLMTLITGMIRASEAIERAASIEITVKSQILIWNAIDSDPIYSNEKEWGWMGHYHTHPKFGIFYSDCDRKNFKQVYTAKYHVGMVIDPVRDEFGFFGWNDDQSDVIRFPDSKVVFLDDKEIEKILLEHSELKELVLPASELTTEEKQLVEEDPVDLEEDESTSPLLGP